MMRVAVKSRAACSLLESESNDVLVMVVGDYRHKDLVPGEQLPIRSVLVWTDFFFPLPGLTVANVQEIVA